MYCGNLESFERIDRMELISKGYLKKKKISCNKKEFFLRSIFSPHHNGNPPPKGIFMWEGIFIQGGNSFHSVFYIEKTCVRKSVGCAHITCSTAE